MYKVIQSFYDLQDYKETKGGRVCHLYRVGDEYPRTGLKPSEERIRELSSDSNRQGRPLIAEEKADEPEKGDLKAEAPEGTDVQAEPEKAPRKSVRRRKKLSEKT